jgi:hypothetical protein
MITYLVLGVKFKEKSVNLSKITAGGFNEFQNEES